MSDPSPHTLRAGRPRRIALTAAAVALLAVIALAAAALIPGSHASRSVPLAQAATATATATTPVTPRVHGVYGAHVSARRYAAQVAAAEDGVNAKGQLVSDLPPIRPARFRHPIAEFRHYAERWALTLTTDSRRLTAALRSGDRSRSRSAWATAFSAYLHLGAVYGLLPGNLNDRLAGLPPVIGSTRFSGLHRIEMGLWTGEPVRSLVHDGVALSSADAALRRELPHVSIGEFAYVTRTHEILEDAQRDLMSGTEVPWSKAGVLGTAAGLAATRELLHTLAPLMTARDDTLGVSEYWLDRLGKVLRGVRRTDGSYPSLGQLSSTQRQRIDAALEGTCNALQQVPPTMEAHPLRTIPTIPGQSR